MLHRYLLVAIVIAAVACTDAGRGTLLAAESAPLPPDSDYVQIQNGHLHRNGERIRFWAGINGQPYWRDNCTTEDIVNMVDRVEAYGFNMMRLFHVRDPQAAYVKGDGSTTDRLDRTIAELKQRGISIWAGQAGSGGHASAEDVTILADPETAAAWQQAVGPKGVGLDHFVASFWDPRLEAIAIRNTTQRLNRVNPYTGLRIADDPVYAVWELTNEQWWIQKMVGGAWIKLPSFFRDSLLAKWHAFLIEKYGTQAMLRKAWTGLLPGEELTQGAVLLAPMRNAARTAALNDANPHAEAKLESVATEYSREDFNARRARDVNEFFTSLLIGHKQRVASAFKQNGKSTQLSPLLWDTGMGFNGINQYMHQNADASSYCAYVGGLTHDESDSRYPWVSGLEQPPRLCLDVPWLEHNRIEGKPFFCYETNIGSPAKYRSEYPYRVLFLASIQDWDIVTWHTLSGGYNWRAETPLIDRLEAPGHAAAQFNYLYDEVLLSAMRSAGAMFRGLSLKPVENPTVFVYGRKTIFGPESMDYAGSYGRNGRDMLSTTYLYGSRVRIDLSRDDDEIIGRTVPLMTWAHPNPLQPTPQMTYDWRKGYLRIDSPAAAAYTGFLGQYGADEVRFDNDVTFSTVSVVNDSDSPYPVTPEETYVSIGLASEDGRALADCRRAILSAVSTSANTGLRVGRDPEAPDRPRHVWEGSKVFERGTLPVRFSRVACTVTAPALAGMHYRMRDWRWQVIAEGEIAADGVLVIDGTLPVFVVELERTE
ncbi:MAG: hypothetical protein PF961_01180 [Planctomycetota bacterium]|jgi:hypothetical protein|nr:hypothetical protein [Planctomycetota bacterium]